jgi:hypothetical protein
MSSLAGADPFVKLSCEFKAACNSDVKLREAAVLSTRAKTTAG